MKPKKRIVLASTADLDALVKSGAAVVTTGISAVREALLARAGEGGPDVDEREVVLGEEKLPVMRAVSGVFSKKADGSPEWDLEMLREGAQRSGIVWQDDFASRGVAYWASDSRPDSHGDIVLQDWSYNRFKDNPVMPYDHRWWEPPVANAVNWQVLQRKTADYQGKALWLLALFASADISQWADSVFRLVRSGFLKGGSVGFVPMKVIDVKDQAEREKLGLGRWGFVLGEPDLLEFSPTTLGANAGAFSLLQSAKRQGDLKPEDFSTILEIERSRCSSAGNEEEWERIDSKYVAMARTLFPRTKFQRHKDLDEPVLPVQEAPKLVSVPVPEKKSIEESLETMRVFLEDTLTGLVQQVSDIRDIVESMSNESMDEEDDPDEEPNSPPADEMPEDEEEDKAEAEDDDKDDEDKDDDNKDKKGADRIAALLTKLEAARSACGAAG